MSPEMELVKKTARMQKNCQNCVYYQAHMCAYIDVVGHPRFLICEAGDACTVKVTKTRANKVGITIRKGNENEQEESTGTGAVHGFRPYSEGI